MAQQPRERVILACLAVGVALLAVPDRADAVAGIEGTFEYAIDAPWRIEPSGPVNAREYGSVPIQISIFDALLSSEDHGGPLGRVCNVITFEDAHVPSDEVFDEVERVVGLRLHPTPTELCRAWRGESCDELMVLTDTSEWHGLVFHDLRGTYQPGDQVPLTVEVTLSRDRDTPCAEVPEEDIIMLRNHLRVLLAPAPLPRFDDTWVYGDLHYHSQGTDNEGESAYNYRGVIRAMGAIGIDFVVAAEHASNGGQVSDADIKEGLDPTAPFSFTWAISGARDMTPEYFGFYHDLIHAADGVNAEAALRAGAGRLPQNVLSHGVTPQILLGGEVDVVPEIRPDDIHEGVLSYGDHRGWGISELCGGWQGQLLLPECDPSELLEEFSTPFSGFFAKDVVGINVFEYARNHLIYIPSDGADRSAFVASNTSQFGGATRRWVNDLHAEIGRRGYVFIAHPMAAPQPGSEAPDHVPWTDGHLRQMWASPEVLGLQFWNEDNRLREKVDVWEGRDDPGDDKGYERDDGILDHVGVKEPGVVPTNDRRGGFDDGRYELRVSAPIDGHWDLVGGAPLRTPLENERVALTLKDGMFAWDRLNHLGLDAELSGFLDWVPQFQPRRLFMAGGSDAHGDLNYRRVGWFIRTKEITDTALGKPRNLLQIPSLAAGAPTHEQIVASLREGRFSITDGPALRIAVDRNDNGRVDADDVPMGGVVELHGDRTLPLLIEWKSTTEFGPLRQIDLYVGARSSREDLQGVHEEGRTYAPLWSRREFVWHGPVNNQSTGFFAFDGEPEDPPYNQMTDFYWEDPTGTLKIDLGDGVFEGTRLVNIDLSQFVVRRDVAADRFFVRAFAHTHRLDPARCALEATSEETFEAWTQGLCIHRYAFTNPIWAIDNAYVCSAEAGKDLTAPEAACNAPATLVPPDQPVSFTATATDACDVTVTVSAPECFSFTKKGKKVARDCVVAVDGDTVTLVDGGGVASHIQWQLTASDAAGNTSATTCEIQLIHPGKRAKWS